MRIIYQCDIDEIAMFWSIEVSKIGCGGLSFEKYLLVTKYSVSGINSYLSSILYRYHSF